MLLDLAQDTKLAFRQAMKQPGTSLAAVATLAIAIGANTAVFSVVNDSLLRALPYPAPEQIVQIEELHESPSSLTGATAHDLRQQLRLPSSTASFRLFPYNFMADETPELVSGAVVTPAFFDVLGVAPRLGRAFAAAEYSDEADVVVLSHGFWVRRFGAAEDIVGQPAGIDGRERLVVGVMPEAVEYPSQVDIWLPITDGQRLIDNRRAHLFTTIARLPGDQTLAALRGELQQLAQRVTQTGEQEDGAFKLAATPLQRRLTANSRPILLMLLGAVGLVLLIACSNVANLLLAQGLARESELAVAGALGATPGRLLRKLTTESVWMALVGGALALGVATWSLSLLRAFEPDPAIRLDRIAIDLPVLGFAFAISLATGLFCGVMPALRVCRGELAGALVSGKRSSGSVGQGRLRDVLVVAQVALALVLLIGAGLLVRSLQRLHDVDTGYQPTGLFSTWVALSYSDFSEHVAFYEAVEETVSRSPGVENVSWASALPTRVVASTTFSIAGGPATVADQEASANILSLGADYFRMMQIPVLSGRAFDGRDGIGAPVAAIVNEKLVARYFDGADPIGQRITMTDWEESLEGTIVGVVADTRMTALDLPPEPTIYYHYPQFGYRVLAMTLVARVQGPEADPMSITNAVRAAVAARDPELPLVNTASVEEVIERSIGARRFTSLLLSCFSLLAALLALIGVTSVLNHGVAQRVREIGIRRALGASGANVATLVLGRVTGLMAIGILIGVAVAAGLSRLLAALLFEITPTDPTAFLATPLALFAVALACSVIPLQRALRADPVSALRR